MIIKRARIVLKLAFKHKLLILFLILSLGTGCASVRSAYRNYKQNQSERYNDALTRWTAQAQVYRGFETVYLATGTYKSPAFCKAFVNKYAKDYRLDSAAADRMMRDELARAKDSFEFILAASAGARSINLESRDSLWRVYLDIEGFKQQSPIEIRNLKKERVRLKAFYSYITPWDEIYRIRFRRFPLPESVNSICLVQTGVFGTAKLFFKLTD